MKKRFSIVLALTMVFMLMMSTVAMGAVPNGKKVSNTLGLTVNVSAPLEAPSIEVNNDLLSNPAVGLWDTFTVSTTPGGYGGQFVKGKVALTGGNSEGFTLEYLEQNSEEENYEKYLSMKFENNEAWFGPGEGFPLGAVSDSAFRVTWNEVGTYKFRLSIMGGEKFGEELAYQEVEVTVSEINEPVALTHSLTEPSHNNPPADLTAEAVTKENINEGDEFYYTVAAELDENIAHVDGVVYILEVTKEDVGITVGDFVVTEILGHDTIEGINETFAVGEDETLRGYWGPSDGSFTLEDEQVTTLKVKFNTEGKYTVYVHAIQVEAPEGVDLDGDDKIGK